MPIRVSIKHASNGYLQITPSAYSEAFRQHMRTCPGAQWDPVLKCYRVPQEAANILLAELDQRRITAGCPQPLGDTAFRMDHGGRDWIRDYSGLYGYQTEGVNFIQTKLDWFNAAILADEMGLGKSAQALRAAEVYDHSGRRLLIVCPAVVKGHWKDQCKKWLGSDASILTVKKIPKWESGIAIVSWDALRTWGKKMPPADCVIADELHYISHQKSQRSKAFRNYLTAAGRPVVIGLTGTPMETRPRDLWNPLDTLFPSRWGGYYSFAATFCEGRRETVEGVGTFWRDDGASNLDVLNERLRAVMLRRTKGEVGLELPERVRSVLPVELPKEARKACQLAAADANLQDGTEVGRVLSLVEHHKILPAVELARNIIENGGRPLIVTTRRETARAIGEALGCPTVDGQVLAEDRKDWLLMGGGPAVATMYSITTGIDLVEFDSMVFVGLDWVPSRLLQVEARIHRIGQGRRVNVYYLVGMGTLDESIREVVIERLQTFGAAIGNSPEEARLSSELKGQSDAQILESILAMAREGED